MKTKFILHGGRLKLKDERNNTYFQELARDLVDGDEVLFIGFATMDDFDRSDNGPLITVVFFTTFLSTKPLTIGYKFAIV